MSINKTLYPLRTCSTGLSQEDPSRHDCTIVDWDVKYQIKSIYDTLKSLLSMLPTFKLSSVFDKLMTYKAPCYESGGSIKYIQGKTSHEDRITLSE